MPADTSAKGAAETKLSGAESVFYNKLCKLPRRTLHNDELSTVFPGQTTEKLMPVINSLLGLHLLRIETVSGSSGGGSGGGASVRWVAVSKQQAAILGKMDTDESLVYNAIREAGNEGMWSKHIKDKVHLHQTVANKCLKTLETQRIIKVVKSGKVTSHPLSSFLHLRAVLIYSF